MFLIQRKIATRRLSAYLGLVIAKEGFVHDPGGSAGGVGASRAAAGGRETSKQRQMEAESFAGEIFEWSVLLGKCLGECVGSAKQTQNPRSKKGTKCSRRLGFVFKKY